MIRHWGAACAAALVLLAPHAPAKAEADANWSENAAYTRAFATLQLQDQRLQDIGWRLVTGNAAYCSDARLEIGLLLQDVMAFDAPAKVRKASGMTGDIGVQAVAEGSPAAAEGLRSNDEVLEIEGEPTAVPAKGPGDLQRLALLQKRIEMALAAKGRVGLRTRRGDSSPGHIELAGVPACPSRFEIVTGREIAQADGQRVQIGARYGHAADPSSALAGDEYAVIVAHELAHNLLRHQALLDRIGRGWANVRTTERDADRLSVWLLFNAGIDPDIALRTTEGWRRRRDAGLLRAPTHESWRERRAIIGLEIAHMRKLIAATGAADWSKAFVPEVANGAER